MAIWGLQTLGKQEASSQDRVSIHSSISLLHRKAVEGQKLASPRLRTVRLRIPLPSLDPHSTRAASAQGGFEVESGAVFPGHKYDGKFVRLAVTGPWLINFTVINHG